MKAHNHTETAIPRGIPKLIREISYDRSDRHVLCGANNAHRAACKRFHRASRKFARQDLRDEARGACRTVSAVDTVAAWLDGSMAYMEAR